MEEDIISELPCTLSIEDSTEDSTGLNKTDEVSYHFCVLFFFVFFVKSKSWLEEDVCGVIVELTLHHTLTVKNQVMECLCLFCF